MTLNHTSGVTARVRGVMAEKGVTQETLASLLGVTQSYISRRLSGAVDLRVAELQQVAEVLGVPVTRLLPDEKMQGVES